MPWVPGPSWEILVLIDMIASHRCYIIVLAAHPWCWSPIHPLLKRTPLDWDLVTLVVVWLHWTLVYVICNKTNGHALIFRLWHLKLVLSIPTFAKEISSTPLLSFTSSTSLNPQCLPCGMDFERCWKHSIDILEHVNMIALSNFCIIFRHYFMLQISCSATSQRCFTTEEHTSCSWNQFKMTCFVTWWIIMLEIAIRSTAVFSTLWERR